MEVIFPWELPRALGDPVLFVFLHDVALVVLGRHGHDHRDWRRHFDISPRDSPNF